jgi:hypothetical protein
VYDDYGPNRDGFLIAVCSETSVDFIELNALTAQNTAVFLLMRNSNSRTQNRRDGTSLRLQNHSSVIARTIPFLFLAPHTLSFLSQDFEISSCALFLMKIIEVVCVEEFSLLRFNAV